MMKKTIAIDFDGVIHAYTKGWQDGKIYDKPVDGCFFSIAKLLDCGYDVFIFTTRKDVTAIREWLLPHAEAEVASHVALTISELPITSEKLPAIAYIDDRAIRFTNWEDVRKYFV